MREPGATQSAEDPKPGLTGLTGALGGAVELPPFQVKIGKYQLKREIDSGGMGTVFEAIQEQPRRSVAIKLMRGGTQSASAQRRFEFESQLLARLRHPGIAQVFDAGTHRQGEMQVPYYVMEYIPGARSITSFCDKHHYTIRQRLELFATVCQALHYAHQRGIIHRDVKPGNIIVDAEGRAKIIDFGVARALDSDLTPPPLQTDADRVVGTLQYMSPEQCDADPQELDARTDVYALGVVLYELLCARLPYQLSRVNLSDASRIIREEPPVAPRQVRPDLSPDLETVLLKAIHKERSRRYFSAEELANDIRHVLADEPIEARRDSASYVLRKRAGALVAAHKISTWIVATVVAFLLAVGFTALLHRWTPARLLFHRTITSLQAPANASPPMSTVRMIAIQAGPELTALAKRYNLDLATDPQALRVLHGLLFKKLEPAGAHVLVVDILFEKPEAGPGPTSAPIGPERLRFEDELLEGIQALKRGGCEVVLAAGEGWLIGPDDLPPTLTSGIAAHTHWGFTTCTAQADAPWSLDLIIRPNGAPSQASLALAACAARWRRGHWHWVDFDFDLKANKWYAKVSYLKNDPNSTRPRSQLSPVESFFDRVRISQMEFVQQDLPGWHRRYLDAIGHYVLHVPSDPVLQEATVDYAAVFDATPQQLEKWFKGRVLILGDARPGRDGPFRAPDGRAHCGFVAHAVGIDSILRSNVILAPPRVVILGMAIVSGTIFGFLGTVGGALIGLAGLHRWRRRLGFTIAWVIVVFAVSLLFYRHRGILLDPTSAVLGAVIAAEVVNLACRERRDRLA